ncbi:interleukin-20 receptor subunit beta isoform X3 [Balaenoptera musculus]|uniref:Interleukin-20 receptor subunit beta isoform X3 n=1 Tax=Balaenoptera musculus TaxID=9771 RepID=A0A8B8XDG8_BALMU|nr:interleukin-20 receptor subunit beta isoform X3 [Balaenoptera musculus]
MVLEEIETSLIMWFSYALIPCLLVDGVAVLPAPQNLSVQSTNMKHVLTWGPVIVPGEIIHYSVEYQGEYESLYMSHIWIPSSWCSPTQGPECDITDDITATVPYSLRVRATLGSLTSAWSTLKHPFNRNATILTPPGMEITKDGFHLVIKLEDLGPQFEFFVAYWKREPGAKHAFSAILPAVYRRQTRVFQISWMISKAYEAGTRLSREHVKMVRHGGIPVHLETMEPGAAHCVKVRTFVKAIGRHSAFSQTECVKVQGETLPLALALFSFVGFMLILVAVPLSVWKMGRLLRHSCCPVVMLPDTLAFRLRQQLYHWLPWVSSLPTADLGTCQPPNHKTFHHPCEK